MKDKVKFFKALGDETRLTILSYLINKNLCACRFAFLTKKDQTTVSRHLKVLTEAGIIKYEKKGRFLHYGIKDKKMKKVLLDIGIKARD